MTTSAGQCTLTDGTVVDLCVYAGAGEGVAWLDGTSRGVAGARGCGWRDDQFPELKTLTW